MVQIISLGRIDEISLFLMRFVYQTPSVRFGRNGTDDAMLKSLYQKYIRLMSIIDKTVIDKTHLHPSSRRSHIEELLVTWFGTRS